MCARRSLTACTVLTTRLGVSMVGSLLWYWTARATSEGAYWLDLYLERRGGDGADDAAMARALFARGYVSMVLGDATTGVAGSG